MLGRDRVFWRGRHAVLGWGSPLGKVHRDGTRVLIACGFEEVDTSTTRVPAFFWNTRRAADFPAIGEGLPLIRLLPQACTDALDDKVRCARLLNAAGFVAAGLVPESFVDLAALQEILERSVTEQQEEAAWEEAREDRRQRRLYFVKHRFGVKGQAVRPMREDALAMWLQDGISHVRGRSEQQFVVQAEVPPAVDASGRKFVLRCHVLVACRAASPPAAWFHHDVITLAHAVPYDVDGTDKAIHVSQSGKGHPPPQLLSELPPTHPAAGESLPSHLRGLVTRMLAAAAPELIPVPRCQRATLYTLLGLDVALSNRGAPMLLEVNSHPAIADGTMSGVPTAVYTRLVQDVLSLLVLPALDGVEPRAGGFDCLPHAFASSLAISVE